MRVVLTVLLALVASASTVAQRQNAPANPLASARAFQCTFSNYAVATAWDGATAQVTSGADNFGYRVADINLRRNGARVVSDTASVPVSAILSQTGLNIIEQTPIGNFILTTIFIAGGTADKYVAVHSRHLGDLSTLPSVSQFYGTCEVAN